MFNGTSRGCTDDAVFACHMAGDAADRSALQAPLGVGSKWQGQGSGDEAGSKNPKRHDDLLIGRQNRVAVHIALGERAAPGPVSWSSSSLPMV